MNDTQRKPWYLRWWALVFYVFVVLGIVGAVALVFRGGNTANEFTSASNPQPLATVTKTAAAPVAASATPSPTPSVRFKPWPPGTASAAETLAVADRLEACTRAETLASAHLLAPDSTLDIWLADEHYRGAAVVDYYAPNGATTALDWSKGTVLATAGAAVVECTVTNVAIGFVMRGLTVLTVSNGKVTHQEIYGVPTDSRSVARPKPVAIWPGPANTAAAARAAVSAYYTALTKGDVTAAAALCGPPAIFQDTNIYGEAGGVREAMAWQTRLAAVPNMSLELKSLVAGKGWAVARWLLSGDTSSGSFASVPGASLFEVRYGKIVRQTLYYNAGESPLS